MTKVLPLYARSKFQGPWQWSLKTAKHSRKNYQTFQPLGILTKHQQFTRTWNFLPTICTVHTVPTHHQAGFFESYQDSRARIFSQNSSFIVSHHLSFSIKKCSGPCSVSLAKHGTLRKRQGVITQHGLRLPLGGMKPIWKLWHRVSELHCICTKIDRHCAYNYWTQQHDGHLIRFSGI